MKYKLDELLLDEIDEGPSEPTDIFSMETVMHLSLKNHVAVTSSECSITNLCFNDNGTLLASGCKRGLVYVSSFEVSLKALCYYKLCLLAVNLPFH